MIAIGSDHAGYRLKLAIEEHLKEQGIPFEDLGCYGPERVDYPVYGQKVAEAVAEGKYRYGIVICGTGIGISLAANKVPGIRCAVCSDTYSAKYTRLHNDANMLAMGERVVGPVLRLRSWTLSWAPSLKAAATPIAWSSSARLSASTTNNYF